MSANFVFGVFGKKEKREGRLSNWRSRRVQNNDDDDGDDDVSAQRTWQNSLILSRSVLLLRVRNVKTPKFLFAVVRVLGGQLFQKFTNSFSWKITKVARN